jgi:hypothetical protein
MAKKLFYTSIFIMLILGAKAQGVKSSDSLYRQIIHLDSMVFNAFNTRDTITFNRFFSKDLEFYHDKGGLTGFQLTADFAKAQADRKTDLKRTLVPGTLEVYPVPNYGAIQIGSHKFTHTENGKEVGGIFKFVHVWKKLGNEWKITRILSYDH